MSIQLPLLGKSYPFTIAGVFRDYARQHGAILIDRRDYAALTGDRRVNDGAVWLAPGTTPAAMMERLRPLPGGDEVDIAAPGEIRSLSLRLFGLSFPVTSAMEA